MAKTPFPALRNRPPITAMVANIETQKLWVKLNGRWTRAFTLELNLGRKPMGVFGANGGEHFRQTYKLKVQVPYGEINQEIPSDVWSMVQSPSTNHAIQKIRFVEMDHG